MSFLSQTYICLPVRLCVVVCITNLDLRQLHAKISSLGSCIGKKKAMSVLCDIHIHTYHKMGEYSLALSLGG